MKKYIPIFIVGFVLTLLLFFGPPIFHAYFGFRLTWLEHIIDLFPKNLFGLYFLGGFEAIVVGLLSTAIYALTLIIRKVQTTPSFLFFSFLFFSFGSYAATLLFLWAFLAAFSNGPG